MNIVQSTMNQRGNASNPHQTEVKRVLCICSAGLLRSPTLANVLHQQYGYNTRAVGACKSFALIPISEALLIWADQIVFTDWDAYREATADPDDAEEVAWATPSKDLIILDIPDSYEWNHPTLREACLVQYKEATDE